MMWWRYPRSTPWCTSLSSRLRLKGLRRTAGAKQALGHVHALLDAELTGQPVLDPGLDERPDRRQRKVIDRGHDEDLKRVKSVGADRLCDEKHLADTDHRQHGGGLHHPVERVAQRRHHDPQ